MTVTIENGSWYFEGNGAGGFKKYRMGPSDEVTRNQHGYETGFTVQEAYSMGILEVDEKTGQPVCNKFKDA